VANESVDPADGRFAPILLKKSISEGSRFLREGLVRSLGNYVGDLVIGSLFNERPIQGHCEATNSRRTISIYVSRKFLAASILSFSTKSAPSRRLANTTSSRPARSYSGPFDGGDDALAEAAGEGDREIGSAGRDRPADGEGGPPSHHKIIPPADIEERQRRSGQKR
jgi:hypothetical protein